jgi:hypothetical protein
LEPFVSYENELLEDADAFVHAAWEGNEVFASQRLMGEEVLLQDRNACFAEEESASYCTASAAD